MEAEVDFDIIAHLGYFRNVDLLEKGLYLVKVSLYYGKSGTKLPPVGMFSSPSTLDSYVRTQQIPATKLISVSELDSMDETFRSRAVVIRYKDERHELNDGVHWRITIPKYDMSELSRENMPQERATGNKHSRKAPAESDLATAAPLRTDQSTATAADRCPRCSEPLHLKFELLHSPLLDDKKYANTPSGAVAAKLAADPSFSLFDNVNMLVPEEPQFSLLSTQNVMIQQVGSGLHEYFPVRFDRMHAVNLDTMIHCAVTSIRYPRISFADAFSLSSMYSRGRAPHTALVHGESSRVSNREGILVGECEGTSESLAGKRNSLTVIAVRVNGKLLQREYNASDAQDEQIAAGLDLDDRSAAPSTAAAAAASHAHAAGRAATLSSSGSQLVRKGRERYSAVISAGSSFLDGVGGNNSGGSPAGAGAGGEGTHGKRPMPTGRASLSMRLFGSMMGGISKSKTNTDVNNDAIIDTSSASGVADSPGLLPREESGEKLTRRPLPSVPVTAPSVASAAPAAEGESSSTVLSGFKEGDGEAVSLHAVHPVIGDPADTAAPARPTAPREAVVDLLSSETAAQVEDVRLLFDTYSGVVITNYRTTMASTRRIIEVYLRWQTENLAKQMEMTASLQRSPLRQRSILRSGAAKHSSQLEFAAVEKAHSSEAAASRCPLERERVELLARFEDLLLRKTLQQGGDTDAAEDGFLERGSAAVNSAVGTAVSVTGVEEEAGERSHTPQKIGKALAASIRSELNQTSSSSLSMPLLGSGEREIEAALSAKIDECNLHLTARWSLLMSAFRRSMPAIRDLMLADSRRVMRYFWRNQALVHTRSVFETDKHLVNEEHALFSVMTDCLVRDDGKWLRERRRQRTLSAQAKSAVLAGDARGAGASKVARNLFEKFPPSLSHTRQMLMARGLPVFDADVHLASRRLPVLLIQQYIDNVRADGSDTASAVSLASSEEGFNSSVESDRSNNAASSVRTDSALDTISESDSSRSSNISEVSAESSDSTTGMGGGRPSAAGDNKSDGAGAAAVSPAVARMQQLAAARATRTAAGGTGGVVGVGAGGGRVAASRASSTSSIPLSNTAAVGTATRAGVGVGREAGASGGADAVDAAGSAIMRLAAKRNTISGIGIGAFGGAAMLASMVDTKNTGTVYDSSLASGTIHAARGGKLLHTMAPSTLEAFPSNAVSASADSRTGAEKHEEEKEAVLDPKDFAYFSYFNDPPEDVVSISRYSSLHALENVDKAVMSALVPELPRRCTYETSASEGEDEEEDQGDSDEKAEKEGEEEEEEEEESRERDKQSKNVSIIGKSMSTSSYDASSSEKGESSESEHESEVRQRHSKVVKNMISSVDMKDRLKQIREQRASRSSTGSAATRGSRKGAVGAVASFPGTTEMAGAGGGPLGSRDTDAEEEEEDRRQRAAEEEERAAAVVGRSLTATSRAGSGGSDGARTARTGAGAGAGAENKRWSMGRLGGGSVSSSGDFLFKTREGSGTLAGVVSADSVSANHLHPLPAPPAVAAARGQEKEEDDSVSVVGTKKSILSRPIDQNLAENREYSAENGKHQINSTKTKQRLKKSSKPKDRSVRPSAVAAKEKEEKEKEPDPPTVHLVVLQHGFLGCSYDMRLIANCIAVDYPEYFSVLCSVSNEDKTHDSIAQMGKRLAFEVQRHCKEKWPLLLNPNLSQKTARISFIGHSLGGLIIRRALQEPTMKALLPKLHCFVSLASPHLGTLFAESQLVSTGMRAIFHYKQSRCLKELVLEDGIGGKVRKSLMYKLSETPALPLFRKVLLVSSLMDQYVPTYSARIQTNAKVESDAAMGPVIAEMTRNLLSPLRADQLVRVCLSNVGNPPSTGTGAGIAGGAGGGGSGAAEVLRQYEAMEGKSLRTGVAGEALLGGDGAGTGAGAGLNAKINNALGRTAHICYLENEIVATQLMLTLYDYLTML